MEKTKKREDMNIVIVGHVDHGKSTIIGRLLADTDSLPEGKLESVKEQCRRNSKPFEYAFLLDALKDEQAQGITIDSARVFFQTQKREYIIIDAPGHIEFLKNMVTGAARAEAALLVIDANEGIQENSKRHGYLLSMLGIEQVVVIVNKMDLIDYDREKYNDIITEYSKFLEDIDIEPAAFIPVSGMEGDNISKLSQNTPWYKDETVLEILDKFKVEEEPIEKPFRMPVQDIYKFTRDGDDRRIVAGTIYTGKVKVGDNLVFYPSGKKSKVKSIEAFNKPEHDEITAGYSTGLTLTEQIYIRRGEIAVLDGQKRPVVSKNISVNLFWLGRKSLQIGKKYHLKLGTAKVGAKLKRVERIIDASTLDNSQKKTVDRHDVAECILELDKAIAFDNNLVIQDTSRFVLIDKYDIAGGGIINHGITDEQSKIREQVLLRNYNWELSMVGHEERSEIYNHNSTLIIVTGKKGTGRRDMSKALEKDLLITGKKAYYLGVENLEYGIDADLVNCRKCNKHETKEEKVRRFAETAHILIDSGNILITTVVELKKSEIDTIKTIVGEEKVKTVWVGGKNPDGIEPDFHINDMKTAEAGAEAVKSYLKEEAIIFGR